MIRTAYSQQLASAMTTVCCSVASSAMVGSVLIRDPREAAKSFGESTRWQIAGVIATLGDPDAVLKFLRDSHSNTPDGVSP